jgi:hypothetical protein
MVGLFVFRLKVHNLLLYCYYEENSATKKTTTGKLGVAPEPTITDPEPIVSAPVIEPAPKPVSGRFLRRR